MIPFLKHKEEAPIIKDDGDIAIKRSPDYDEDIDDDDLMLDAIAEDILSAIGKKDKGLMKESLSALCEYLRMEDEP